MYVLINNTWHIIDLIQFLHRRLYIRKPNYRSAKFNNPTQKKTISAQKPSLKNSYIRATVDSYKSGYYNIESTYTRIGVYIIQSEGIWRRTHRGYNARGREGIQVRRPLQTGARRRPSRAWIYRCIGVYIYIRIYTSVSALLRWIRMPRDIAGFLTRDRSFCGFLGFWRFFGYGTVREFFFFRWDDGLWLFFFLLKGGANYFFLWIVFRGALLSGKLIKLLGENERDFLRLRHSCLGFWCLGFLRYSMGRRNTMIRILLTRSPAPRCLLK